MNSLKKIGTIEIQFCEYDNKEHEVKLTDYIMQLSGNTYEHKEDIKKNGFRWDSDKKCWFKNFENEQDIKEMYCRYNLKGIIIGLKPIFRINDLDK